MDAVDESSGPLVSASINAHQSGIRDDVAFNGWQSVPGKKLVHLYTSCSLYTINPSVRARWAATQAAEGVGELSKPPSHQLFAHPLRNRKNGNQEPTLPQHTLTSRHYQNDTAPLRKILRFPAPRLNWPKAKDAGGVKVRMRTRTSLPV